MRFKRLKRGKVYPNRDSEGILYKFPDRTCKECRIYPCHRGIEKAQCDMAKYGCRKYQ